MMILTLLIRVKGPGRVARARCCIVVGAQLRFICPWNHYLLFAIDQLNGYWGTNAVTVLGNCVACVVIDRGKAKSREARSLSASGGRSEYKILKARTTTTEQPHRRALHFFSTSSSYEPFLLCINSSTFNCFVAVCASVASVAARSVSS